MHAAHRHEGAAHIGKAAGLEIQHPAPLDARSGGIGMLAGGGAGLAADAAGQIDGDRPAGHGPASGAFSTRTRTRSAPDPVASVSASSIGVSAFIDGALWSLAKGVFQ